MKSSEGFIQVSGGRVWYTTMGEGDRTPLLVLHGGPGNTHDPYKAALGVMANERPVIFYDQLGSGIPTDLRTARYSGWIGLWKS